MVGLLPQAENIVGRSHAFTNKISSSWPIGIDGLLLGNVRKNDDVKYNIISKKDCFLPPGNILLLATTTPLGWIHHHRDSSSLSLAPCLFKRHIACWFPLIKTRTTPGVIRLPHTQHGGGGGIHFSAGFRPIRTVGIVDSFPSDLLYLTLLYLRLRCILLNARDLDVGATAGRYYPAHLE